MSLETSSLQITPAANETAIDNLASRMMQEAANRIGVPVSQLPPEAVADARAFARESVESEVKKQSNEYYLLYQQQKAEAEALKAQLGAIRENRTAKADSRTVDTMEQVRERVGRSTWFQFSEAQKLTALGIDPSTVDKAQLRSLFGRATDTSFAVDFMKTNPYRYKQLRQAALALDITGK